MEYREEKNLTYAERRVVDAVRRLRMHEKTAWQSSSATSLPHLSREDIETLQLWGHVKTAPAGIPRPAPSFPSSPGGVTHAATHAAKKSPLVTRKRRADSVSLPLYSLKKPSQWPPPEPAHHLDLAGSPNSYNSKSRSKRSPKVPSKLPKLEKDEEEIISTIPDDPPPPSRLSSFAPMRQSPADQLRMKRVQTPFQKLVVPKQSNLDEEESHFFGLELFDDTSFEQFDDFTLTKGCASMKAFSKWRTTTGEWQWKRCIVQNWDPEREQFLIRWVKNGLEKFVSRLNLRFEKEDELNFHLRIQAAAHNKIISEIGFARQARLDVMPLDGMSPLPWENLEAIMNKMGDDMITRITDGDFESVPSVTSLEELLQQSFQRLCLGINYNVTKPFEEEIPTDLRDDYLRKQHKKLVPSCGVIALPSENTVSDLVDVLSENSLFGDPHLLESIQHIVTLLMSFYEMARLFVIFPDPIDLDYFVEKEIEAASHFYSRIMKSYQPLLDASLISGSEASMRAGAEEDSEDPFMEPDIPKEKPQRLLHLGNVIESQILKQSIRKGLRELTSHFDVDSGRGPLFRLKLCVHNGHFFWTPSLDRFEKLNKILPSAIKQVCQVPALKSSTTLKQHWNSHHIPVQLEDPEVQQVISHMNHEVQLSQEEATKCMANYQKFEPTLKVSAFRIFEQLKGNLDSFHKAISLLDEDLSTIELSMPSSSTFRLFAADLSDAKTFLLTFFTERRKALFNSLREFAKIEAIALKNESERVMLRLRAIPTTAEEYLEQMKFQKASESENNTLEKKSQAILANYYALEEHYFQVTKDDTIRAWDLVSLPRRMKDEQIQCEVNLGHEKFKLRRVLGKNQKALSAQISRFEEKSTKILGCDNYELYVVNRRKVQDLKAKLESIEELHALYSTHEKILEVQPDKSLTSTLEKSQKSFSFIYNLWHRVADWEEQYAEWLIAPFTSIHADAVSSFVKDCYRIVTKVSNYYSDSVAREKPLTISKILGSKISEFRKHLPLITMLRHPGIRSKHLELIAQQVHLEMPTEFTLGWLLEQNFEPHLSVVKEIADIARNEHTMEAVLDRMLNEVRQYNVELVKHEKSGISLLLGGDQLFNMLGDQMTSVLGMQSSPYLISLKERCLDWKDQLIQMQETVEVWLECQHNWLYFFNFFNGSRENQTELQGEEKKFQEVDADWREIMDVVDKNRRLLYIFEKRDLKERFSKNNTVLEASRRKLEQFVEIKRESFPRFFFLSNLEVLDIIASGDSGIKDASMLSKCFTGITSFLLEGHSVTGMTSNLGEAVQLGEHVRTDGVRMEDWLAKFESSMKKTIHDLIHQSLQTHSTESLLEHITKWPSQVVLTVHQIIFNYKVTHILRGKEFSKLEGQRSQIESVLEDLTSLVTSGHLGSVPRSTIKALIVLNTHNRDVLDLLHKRHVDSPNSFEWTSQLRYNWEEDDCFVRMINASFKYSYEYLGDITRLVVTPLTLRCFRTLTTAVSLAHGGACIGPAATGKTETVKDLAKALGKPCLVFNCSAEMNYKSLGNFFTGLATTGSFSCFDEFNRIQVDVLSVVVQHIQTIQEGIRESREALLLGERKIKLNPSCGIFITMNPEYHGRTELPDSLKTLLRPVSMTVADFSYISQVSLFSEGFQTAPSLSHKLTKCFKLAQEQLSIQTHYHFGMRSVITLLDVASSIRAMHPDMDEAKIIVRAFQQSTLPKLFSDDSVIFSHILQDIFPDTSLADSTTQPLAEKVAEALKSKNLQPLPFLVEKAVQLKETLDFRVGVMLIGETYSCKSTCYLALRDALTTQETGIDLHVFNPKAVTVEQLYGHTDSSLHWSDGLLSSLVRSLPTTTPIWIVLDGPVDTLWIEDMNTVFDESRILFLTNGERIDIPPNLRFIFEVPDVEQATPATISRCGMVIMDSAMLHYDALLTTWLNSVLQTLPVFVPRLKALFDSLLPPCLSLLEKSNLLALPMSHPLAVSSFLSIMDGFISQFLPNIESDQWRPSFDLNMESKEESLWTNQKKLLQDSLQKASDLDKLKILDCFVVWSLIWSIGAIFNETGRKDFNRTLRAETETCIQPPFPEGGSVYDYYFECQSQSWVHWLTGIKEVVMDPSEAPPLFDLIVPTNENVARFYLTSLLVGETDANLIFFGGVGVGKSSEISRFLFGALDSSIQSPFQMGFTQRTTAFDIQERLEENMTRADDANWVPAASKKLVCNFTNLNLPEKEKSGTQPPLEFLRQVAEHQRWYSLKEKSLKTVTGLTFLGSFSTTLKSIPSQRILRHFNMIYCPDPPDSSLSLILTTMAKSFFANPIFKADLENIVYATHNTYKTLQLQMKPNSSKPHYFSNPSHIYQVMRGIALASRDKKLSPKLIPQIWAHEMLRTFGDLATEDDFPSVVECIRASTLTCWKSDFSLPLLFFSLPGSHRQITDLMSLADTMNAYMKQRNRESKQKLDLFIFSITAEHIVRIMRILQLQGGNVVLLRGIASQNQVLVNLAAFILEYEVLEITPTPNYKLENWKNDLKRMLNRAGLKSEPVVFIWNQTSVRNTESIPFLEDLANIMETGSVPGLFNANDRVALVSNLNKGVLAGTRSTQEHIMRLFSMNVKRSLRLVLILPYSLESFRLDIRKFPSLVSRTSINYFPQWEMSHLVEVAKYRLKNAVPDDKMEEVVSLLTFLHSSSVAFVERFHLDTNASYLIQDIKFLDLLKEFKTLLKKQKEEDERKAHLQKGMEMLEETKTTANTVLHNLKENLPNLEVTTEQAKQLVFEVHKKNEEVAQRVKEVQQEEHVASEMAAEAKRLEEEAEAELSKVIPMLKQSEIALSKLKRQDITELKQLTKNPSLTILLEALCIIFGRKPKRVPNPKIPGSYEDNWWDAIRALFADANFLSKMVHFNRDSITEDIFQMLQPYTSNPLFTPKAVAKISIACKSLCIWVIAMTKYYHVNKQIQPLRDQLASARVQIKERQLVLDKAKETLKTIQDEASLLQAQAQEAETKKLNLVKEIQNSKITLQNCNDLIEAIGDEKDTWQKELEVLTIRSEFLLPHILLASGVRVYSGPLPRKLRKELLYNWVSKIREQYPKCPNFNFAEFLFEPLDIHSWTASGLTDAHSKENAALLMSSQKWPLILDPQSQAIDWIKQYENRVVILDHDTPQFQKKLRTAIEKGSITIVEIVDSIDQSLEGLILRQLFEQDFVKSIKIGDEVVPYHEDFRLYIVTLLGHQRFPLEWYNHLNILNWTITKPSLKDTILKMVIAHERASLHERKEEIIAGVFADRKQQKLCQDQLLQIIQTEDVIHNDSLRNTLKRSKETSQALSIRIEEAEKNEEEISQAENVYQPIAQRISPLYFAMLDLASLDHMYQFSLTWFLELFNGVLDEIPETVTDETNADLSVSIEFVVSTFMIKFFKHISSGILEKHKLVFSFLLLLKHMTDIDNEELNFLMQGVHWSESQQSKSCAKDKWKKIVRLITEKKDVPTALPDIPWLREFDRKKVIQLAKLNTFRELYGSLVHHSKEWKEFYTSDDPQSVKIPIITSDIQKLVLYRTLRPDKVLELIRTIVESRLGKEYTDFRPTSLSDTFSRSSAHTPILVIFTPGADPFRDIKELATQMEMTNRLQSISLAREVGPIALKMFQEGILDGDWLILQNCHLARSWLPSLEKAIKANVTPHPRFRLWMTSTPIPDFPVWLLQNSIKFTAETPHGIRSNMLLSFQKMDRNLFNKFSEKRIWKPILFTTCFYHALLQERKRFGSLGWNRNYEFNDNDLSVSLRTLETAFHSPGTIPFDGLKYLLAECHYGGKIDDSWDRRVAFTLLDSLYYADRLKPNTRLTTSDHYFIPESSSFDGYVQTIEDMPSKEDPEVLGFHPTAEIATAHDNMHRFFDSIGGIRRPFFRAEGSATLQVIDLISSRIPHLIASKEVEKLHDSYQDPFVAFLYREVTEYNNLIAQVMSSFARTKSVVYGVDVMSPEIENFVSQLLDDHVPDLWKEHCYLTEKPLSAWMTDLSERLSNMREWLQHGAPSVIWISGFFRPRNFIIAFLQRFARKHKIPLEEVSYSCQVISEKKADFPQDGECCYLKGLILEGASWDGQNDCLGESPSDIRSLMPVMKLIPINNNHENTSTRKGNVKYVCPCYVTPSRMGEISTLGETSNFVGLFNLNSLVDPKHWIHHGVALLLST